MEQTRPRGLTGWCGVRNRCRTGCAYFMAREQRVSVALAHMARIGVCDRLRVRAGEARRAHATAACRSRPRGRSGGWAEASTGGGQRNELDSLSSTLLTHRPGLLVLAVGRVAPCRVGRTRRRRALLQSGTAGVRISGPSTNPRILVCGGHSAPDLGGQFRIASLRLRAGGPPRGDHAFLARSHVCRPRPSDGTDMGGSLSSHCVQRHVPAHILGRWLAGLTIAESTSAAPNSDDLAGTLENGA